MTQLEWFSLFICALAAVLHGLCGFGFPMMSTAALSIQYPMQTAVALVVLPCLALNLVMLRADKTRSIKQSLAHYIQQYWPLILSSLIASFIGVKILLMLSEAFLKLSLALILSIYLADQFRSQPMNIQPTTLNMLIFGSLAGVIGGATNAMAPFLMMYLLSSKHQKIDIIIISNLCFIVSKLIQMVLLFPHLGHFDTKQNQLLILLLIIALAGVYIGERIRRYLSQEKFKRLILGILALLALSSFWQALQLINA
ncbi:hypothetical protein F946_00667 [Acinetobacter johnsonii ANC 3681]|uniref:Probable membrane transporter protein n=1 Tax=Acinetobacter johnsonii ANC 3681 TaxID=1217662 RepID=N9CZK0_ACIJO|nr:sulfite exporter TauE/SafE family protein [Acinetobacter johnsonii]ENV73733.1 hypothetical protein F946_00667 [Acinetobacter johnsonii ANC 3681]